MAQPDQVRMGVTTLVIPNRRAEFPEGAEISRQIKGILGDTLTHSNAEMARRTAQVEELAYREFNRGNVPDFMRPENYPEITLEKTIGGRKIQATVKVCPDYMAIGSNTDYVLVPLSAPMAQRIADRYNLALPTQKIVDVIDIKAKRSGSYIPFSAAPTLAQNVTNPHTNKPAVEGEGGKKWNYQKYGFYEGRWMVSGEFIEEQNRLNIDAWKKAGSPAGFRSGHKKDVIYDSRNFKEAAEGGQPVVIYHPPFQGLSNWHNVGYLDYSHGIRFVDGNVKLTITEKDGSVRHETKSYADVLKDPQLYQLISDCRVDTTRLYRGMQIPLEPRPKKQTVTP